jgi:ATP-binding cassette subfamily C protein
MRNVWETWARLWAYLRSHYGNKVWLWAFLLTLTPITEAVSVFLILPLLQSLGLRTEGGPAPQQTLGDEMGIGSDLVSVLALLLIAILAHEVTKLLKARIHVRLHARFVADLREEMFRAVARARWVALARMKLATLHKTITEDVQRSFHALRASEDALLSIMVLAGYTLMAAWVSPLFTGLVLVGGAVYLLAARRPLLYMERLGNEVSAMYGKLYETIAVYLTFIRTFKAYEKVDDAIDRFDGSNNSIVNVHVKEIDTTAGLEAAYKIVGAFGLCFSVYIALGVMQIPPASFFFLVVVLFRMALRIPSVVSTCLVVASHGPSFKHVLSSIEECRAEAEPERIESRSSSADHSPIAIEFEDVSFAYVAATPVLEEFSISIPASKTCAVMGHSGAGKSTFMDILVGLLEPDSGRIRIDGEIAGPQELISLRSATSYVGQEMFLFHGTVRENLLWGAEGASSGEIDDALEAAQAAAFVTGLARGMETVVGDRGVMLSSGQRQRLALARALLRRPRLLILDEPTSSLDIQSENQIVRSLESIKGSTTILIVSHRLNAIRCADVVYLLEGGCSRAIGTGADVFNRSSDLGAAQPE